MYLYINMWSVSFYLHSFISWDSNQSFQFVTTTWPNPPVFESFESEWKAVPPQNSPNKKLFTDKHFGKHLAVCCDLAWVTIHLDFLVWTWVEKLMDFSQGLCCQSKCSSISPLNIQSLSKALPDWRPIWVHEKYMSMCLVLIFFIFFTIRPRSLQLFKECSLLSRQHHYNIINKRHWCEGQQICFPVCQSLQMDFLPFLLIQDYRNL